MLYRLRPFLLLISLASAIAIGGTGCQADRSPGAGMADPYPAQINDPRITVLAPDLRGWIGFQEFRVAQDEDKPLSVNVPVRNMTERQYLIDYRFLFYDEDGMQISPVMGWQMVAMEPKQNVRLEGSALDRSAVDFRLEVRWAR